MHWTNDKKEAWFFMNNKLGLFEPNVGHHQDHMTWYTWINLRAKLDRVLKWLCYTQIE